MKQNYCAFCSEKLSGEVCDCCGKSITDYHTAPHWLLPGTVLAGKYEVGAVLGEGGFGITYIGRDTNLDMKVAIKEYFPSGVVNRNNTSSMEISALVGDTQSNFEKGKQGFLSEARTHAKFSNEQSIVSVRDFFEENNTAYIVMEYLEGIDLKDFIAQNGKMSFGLAISMLSPIMSSLSKIHNQGLIHRDISPANIMILNNRTVKLLDFGSARNVSGADEKSLSVLLKPGFAPEEQYRSKGNQGSWTDVYALSATLYKMVTGVTPDDAMNRLFSDEVVSPSELNEQITPEQSAVILKGMSIYQKDRYQTVEELQQACNDALNGKNTVNSQAEPIEKTISRKSAQNTVVEKTINKKSSPVKSSSSENIKQPVEEKSETPISNPIPQAAQQANCKKSPKKWGLIGSIIAGLIALFNISFMISDMADPTLQTGDYVKYIIEIVIFAAIAIGCGYFYYPRVDKTNLKPNKIALIASIVLTVVALVLAFIGFVAFGSDLASNGDPEAFMAFAVLFAGPALYLGYFYYPRLEKKVRSKFFKVYGSAFAAIIVCFVLYTVFVTMSSISIGDEKIKKNAETVEITADLLTDGDIEKLSQLKNLKELSIQACFLDDNDVKVIGTMTGLEKLSLVGNTDIKDITPLSNLSNLTFLNLELTGVEDVSCLSKLTELTHLSFSESKVKDVSVVKDLSKLEVFYMNNLENLDETTIKVPMGLMEFYCNNNGLTNIEFLRENIALNKVELSGNNITDISPLSTKPLSAVNVNSNKITDISPIAVTNFELKATDNQISDISCLKGTKAEFIFLSNNKISDISAFEANDGLRTLELKNNNIVNISALKDCFNISTLDLSGNQIADISAIATIDNLSNLDLRNNQIADISPLAENQKFIDSKPVIYLSNNKIADLTPLSNFKNSDSIWLDNNLIEDISPLTACTNLERLSIKNNRISDLSVLSGMANLNRVLAVGNPVVKIDGLNLSSKRTSAITGEKYSSDSLLGGSILSISYTDKIDWAMAKTLKIDDIRVYDIPPRQRAAMDDLGYRTNYDSSVQEETDE